MSPQSREQSWAMWVIILVLQMSRIKDKRDEVPGNRAHSKVQDLIPDLSTPNLASFYL